MITLMHPLLVSRIVLTQDAPTILTVEHPDTLTSLVQDLHAQTNNETGGFQLCEDLKPVNIAKELSLVHSPFALDFEQRKLLTRIQTDLNQLSMSPEHYQSTATIQTALQNYLHELECDYTIPLQWDVEICAANIAKAANLSIMTDGLSLPERILLFLQAATTLKLARFFVFVHLRPFLTPKQLRDLFYEARLKKYCLMLIEAKDMPRCDAAERRLTLDADLCEIANDFADMK